MEKNSHSSGGDSTVTTGPLTGVTTGTFAGVTTASNSGGNVRNSFYLNHLHKVSQKIISKPIKWTSNHMVNEIHNQNFQTPPPIPPPQGQPGSSGVQSHAPLQQQPPVYNVTRNEFRDAVQRLTGSPAHERSSAPPPPIQQSKPASSRLQRIRPPPLAQISNRPPGLPQIGSNLPGNLMNSAPAANPVGIGATNDVFFGGQLQPVSPLPPFPAVHAAAESPVSAYMRYLQDSTPITDSPPRWCNIMPPPQPQPQPQPQLQQQNTPPATQASMALPEFPTFPASPLPFGCVPSSTYPPQSPNGQLGFQQFPVSPTVPLPSPKWRSI